MSADTLPPGYFWRSDGTLGMTDEAIRAALPAVDAWPDNPDIGDLAQRANGTLWAWTGEDWWNPRLGYWRLWVDE